MTVQKMILMIIPQNLPASNYIKTLSIILSISILEWYICFLECWKYQSSLKSFPKPVSLRKWGKIQEMEILGDTYVHMCMCACVYAPFSQQ